MESYIDTSKDELKAKLYNELNDLLKEMYVREDETFNKEKSKIFDWILFFNTYKIEDLINKCIDLQEKLSDIEDDDIKQISQIRIQVMKIRVESKKLKTPYKMLIFSFIPYLLILILLCSTMVYFSETIVSFINESKNLIFFGIIGAISYFLSYLEKKSSGIVFNLLIRFLFAIIIPIILIQLIFESGKVREANITPELISFTCGYSSKLVIDILNKLVEKGSKIIDAI
ncbi:hypothetical protein [Tepidibacter hydrothermalis]|uniref:Uncharacterized protein n=1 Tax=Tepidibacter hydrothermalis TaxID=3036126 RepID=A0ABY8EEC6_9FIRM|nr:hypothetical protein [Tepidibacter hydrothermalis]WFD09180.1 hypothetical protein P4S50_12380 [Tepidibacter hydrothermalis]